MAFLNSGFRHAWGNGNGEWAALEKLDEGRIECFVNVKQFEPEVQYRTTVEKGPTGVFILVV